MNSWVKKNYIHVLVTVALLALGTFAGFKTGYILAEFDVRDDAIRHGCGQYDYLENDEPFWKWTK